MVLPLLGHVSSIHWTHYQPINNINQNILKHAKQDETKKYIKLNNDIKFGKLKIADYNKKNIQT